MKSFTVNARDSYPLSVHVFLPSESNGKLLLINSATGVKQPLYFAFAQYASEQGFTVITYDYRGIGQSKPKKLKGFSADMKMWGAVDFEAVSEWLEHQFPELEKFCLGHSVGALIMGMNPHSQIFSKFIFLATQKAYFGNLNWKTKWSAIFGFGIIQPFLTSVLGYFPAQYLGLGEPLPQGCAFDWRTLIMYKNSTNDLLKATIDISKELQQSTLFLTAEDDTWVTKKGMKLLIAESYPNLLVQYKELKTSQSPKNSIGHVNFFRSYNQPLWQIPLDWLVS